MQYIKQASSSTESRIKVTRGRGEGRTGSDCLRVQSFCLEWWKCSGNSGDSYTTPWTPLDFTINMIKMVIFFFTQSIKLCYYPSRKAWEKNSMNTPTLPANRNICRLVFTLSDRYKAKVLNRKNCKKQYQNFLDSGIDLEFGDMKVIR